MLAQQKMQQLDKHARGNEMINKQSLDELIEYQKQLKEMIEKKQVEQTKTEPAKQNGSSTPKTIVTSQKKENPSQSKEVSEDEIDFDDDQIEEEKQPLAPPNTQMNSPKPIVPKQSRMQSIQKAQQVRMANIQKNKQRKQDLEDQVQIKKKQKLQSSQEKVVQKNISTQQVNIGEPKKKKERQIPQLGTFKLLSISMPGECTALNAKNKRYTVIVSYIELKTGQQRSKTVHFGVKGKEEYIDHKKTELRTLRLNKLTQNAENPFHPNFYMNLILNGQHQTIKENYWETIKIIT